MVYNVLATEGNNNKNTMYDNYTTDADGFTWNNDENADRELARKEAWMASRALMDEEEEQEKPARKTRKASEKKPVEKSTLSAADVLRVFELSSLFEKKGESWQKSWEEEFTFRCYREYTKSVGHYKFNSVWQQWRTCFINEVHCSCLEQSFFSSPGYVLEMYLGETARQLNNFKRNNGFGYWNWVRASRMAREEGKWTAHVHVRYTREKGWNDEEVVDVSVDRLYWVDTKGVEHTVAQYFTKEEVDAAKKETKTVKAALAKLAPWGVCHHRHGDTYFVYAYQKKR